MHVLAQRSSSVHWVEEVKIDTAHYQMHCNVM